MPDDLRHDSRPRCSDEESRDALPGLLHGRLDAGHRVRLEAHLAGCRPCREELALLDAARAGLRRTAVPLDLTALSAGVVAAMRAAPAGAATARPRPEEGRPALRVERGGAVARPGGAGRPRRPAWSAPGLRAAAAVLVVALGAGGVLLARGDATPTSAGIAASVRPAAASAPAGDATVAAAGAAGAGRVADGAAAAPVPSLGASFADLSDAEFDGVLAALDRGADALVPAEPADAGAELAPWELAPWSEADR